MNCVGTCMAGYNFPDGSTRMILQCYAHSGIWHPTTTFQNCVEENSPASERYRQPEQYQQQHEDNDESLSLILRRCQKPSSPTNGYFRCTHNDVHMKCVGRCNAGYSFPGRLQMMELECLSENGVWRPHSRFPDCTSDQERYQQEHDNAASGGQTSILQRCQRPSAPAGGSFSCTYDSTQMTCIARCHPGYHFPGRREEMQLQCMADTGYWRPYIKFPDCTRETEGYEQGGNSGKPSAFQSCHPPVAPVNGYYNCKYDETKMICTAKCNPGYAFPGSIHEMQMQCYARNGYWYPSKYLDCVRERNPYPEELNKNYEETLRRCPTPPAPANGKFECKYNESQMVCVGKCYSGYLFPGRLQEMQLQCQTESGYWYPYRNFPDCSRAGSGHNQGENTGHQQIPEADDSMFIETLSRCPKPESPFPGRVSCNYDKQGMKCKGTCSEGYYFPDGSIEMHLECRTQQGVWYPVTQFPPCHSTGVRTCQVCRENEASGDYDLTVTLRRCKSPGPPIPGRVECKYDTVGMNCTGTCKEGHYFPDRTTQKVVQCLTRSGTWYPTDTYPECTSHTRRPTPEELNKTPEETLNRCKTPNAPANGRFDCKYNESQMVCIGTCNPGYLFPGRRQEMQLQCYTDTSSWYPYRSFPDCSRAGNYQQGEDTENGANEATLARCRRPTSPSPGRVSCSYDSEVMSCFGTCSLGYYFPTGSAEMVLNCSTREGVWRPYQRFPQCERRDDRPCQNCHQREGHGMNDLSVTLNRCKRPSSPIPGRVMCQYDYLGMNCTGTCKEGYYYPDGTREKVTHCSTYAGTWQPLDSFPDCIEYGRRGTYREGQDSHNRNSGLAETLARCRPPSSPVPGRISCSYNSSMMECVGTCFHGYTFPGRSTRMTLQCVTRQAIWYPVDKFPQCEEPDRGTYHGTQVAHEDTSTTTNDLSVTLSRCRSPSSPVPGEVTCQYNSRGMNCTGTCKQGYNFNDGKRDMVLRCATNSGIWYPYEKYPECVEDTYYSRTELERMALERQREERLLRVTLTKCRRPSPITFGYMSCSHDTVGMNCTGRCNSGYYFPDGSSLKYLRCTTERGSWYPGQEFPECIEYGHQNPYEEGQQVVQGEEDQNALTLVKCRKPTTLINGRIYCRHNSVGMNCTGWCNSGYSFLDGSREKVIRCTTVSGTWSPHQTFPSCFESEPVSSPPPELEVPPPARLEDNNLQKTLRNCIRPEVPKNGYIICKHNHFEMNCSGTCNYRHNFPDGSTETSLHCTGETGVWRPSRRFPDCVRESIRGDLGNANEDKTEEEHLLQITLSRCRRPSSPAPGNISCNYDRHGMNCTGICTSGYAFPDGRTEIIVRCNTERASWYPFQIFPTCTAIASTSRCIKPLSPRGGSVTCYNDSRSMTCTGVCSSGHYFPNDRKLIETRCSFVDGVWNPFAVFPDCSRIGVTDDTQQVPDKNENLQQENHNRGDTCKDRPMPPNHGFLSCMEDHDMIKCRGTCLPDYHFIRGETTKELTCSFATGRWTPRSSFPPCFMERTPRPGPSDRYEDNTATSDRNEQVVDEGTDSVTIAELDRVCPRPTTPKAGYIDCTNTGSLRKCTGTCMSGYMFPNGRSYFVLRCSLVGTWSPRRDFPDCIVKDRYTQTEDDRREGAHLTLERNRTSTGSENDYRNNQGTGIQGYCRRPPTPKSGYIYCVYNSNMMECTAQCGPGYKFPSGETRLVHNCEQRTNRWYPTEAFPDCKPVCDSPCYNGGVCVRPNQCFCPQEYRGDYCQHSLSNCDPRQLRFAGSIRCNHTMEETVCELGCPRGTKLDYPSYRIARCSLEGTWTPRYAPRCIDDPDSRPTHGNYENNCGSSQCSSDITEGLCQRPATPNPGTIRCIYNKLMMECTGKCADGYRFTDNRIESIRTCDKRTGAWSPERSFPECKPICERGCQNGGECLAPNLCICPMRFRGDQCQFSFSNCDPHRLRFAGSIRCNHTTKETVCQLGCPAGTVLDRPDYEMVRCSLEGIWTPSVLPRCVEDVTYERRLLASNQQSGMRYEHQYRQSEISRTEAERYEESEENHDKSRDDIQRRQEDTQRYQQRLSRLEQEDKEMFKQQHRNNNNNRGTLSHERDEMSTSEGRFKHYDDFLHGQGREGYETHRSGDRHRSSSHKTEETEEHRFESYQKSVSKQKSETYREHSSQSQHQYSRYHKQHEHSGNGICKTCSH